MHLDLPNRIAAWPTPLLVAVGTTPHLVFLLFLLIPSLTRLLTASSFRRGAFASLLVLLNAFNLVLAYTLSWPSLTPHTHASNADAKWNETRALRNIAVFTFANLSVVQIYRILRLVALVGGRRGERPGMVGVEGWRAVPLLPADRRRSKDDDDHNKRTGDGVAPYPLPPCWGWKRTAWAICAWSALRGVDRWWGQVDEASWPTWPNGVTDNRARWLRYNTWRLLRNLLILDVLNTVSQTRPAFHPTRAVPPWQGYIWGRSQPRAAAIFDTFIAGALGIMALNTTYLVTSLFCVATRLSSPEEWRPLFASPRHPSSSLLRAVQQRGAKEANWSDLVGSIEVAWGRYWHGLFRDSFVALPSALVGWLSSRIDGRRGKTPNDGRVTAQQQRRANGNGAGTVPPPARASLSGRTTTTTTTATSAALLTSLFAFALSALLHALPNGLMLHRLPWGSTAFFLLQPVGIAIERLALQPLGVVVSPSSSSSASPSGGKWARWTGPLWTATWFAATGALLMDEYVEAGFWYIDLVPVGVVKPILRCVAPRLALTTRDDWL